MGKKQKSRKKVVNCQINLMEKMVVREGEPPVNESEESKSEDNFDLNELNEQAVEEVDEEDLDEGFDEEAYRALDAQLDRLNSVLDALEERNDRIHSEMKDMLKTKKDDKVPNPDSDQPDRGSAGSSLGTSH